jgi:hypothetical protein
MEWIPLPEISPTAYLKVRGIEIRLTLAGSRVLFEAPDDAATRQALREFETNTPVGCMDLSNAIRNLRSRMLSMRPPR